jgi:hypothetical protein
MAERSVAKRVYHSAEQWAELTVGLMAEKKELGMAGKTVALSEKR